MKRAALLAAAAIAFMPDARSQASAEAQAKVRASLTSKAYAAGSLRPALTEVAAALKKRLGFDVTFEFGPSGLLRDRLVKGEAADVFASANMEHPQALAAAGKAGPVRMFARNHLCALASPRAGATTANLLEKMLDPAVKLGTSTPKADPSGDYAWQSFERAEKVKAGSLEALSKKALQLTGGPASPAPPAGRNAYAALVSGGQADIFLTYCTNAVAARKEDPSLVMVALPAELAVAADYGVTVLNGATRAGRAFAQYLVSDEGWRVLETHGFTRPPQ